jgi:hypothetical protein
MSLLSVGKPESCPDPPLSKHKKYAKMSLFQNPVGFGTVSNIRTLNI